MTAALSPERMGNAPTNAAKMLRQRTENASETLIQRPERLCACGCGACFTPRKNTQLYVNPKHRQARFIEDKKDATYAFVEALFWAQGGASEMTAARIAQDTVDFYFTARCKALERAGWKYNSEAKQWIYQGAA